MAYEEYVGRTIVADDIVPGRAVAALAATLDVTGIGIKDGDLLPPLWHWILFQDWQPTSSLGIDGHPTRGDFLPPLHDLARRMWAGGNVEFLSPIRIGDRLVRTSRIIGLGEKSGRSGPLVFATVQHDISGPNGPVIQETQDIVFRRADGTAVVAGLAAPAPLADAILQEFRCDPVLLFRYSALTGNSHRIHYDAPFTREVEGYPGLLVQLPLQATILAGLLRMMAPDHAPVRITFRGRRPAFSGQILTLHGWRESDHLRLQSCDPSGAVCVDARAYMLPAQPPR